MDRPNNENPINEDARLLKRYLEQYHMCKLREKALRDRLKRIQNDMKYPLSGINMDGMPKGNTVGAGAPCSFAIRIDEAERRIRDQEERTATTLLNIMDILDFLPENEIERNILEARYIDCFSWTKVCRLVHMSRTPANNHLNAGLAKLLEFKKVQKILADYKASLAKNDHGSH